MFASLHTASLATRRVSSVGSLSRMIRMARQAEAAWRQRQTLANLDDHALADIGLTRDAALAEAQKPLWDLPRQARR